MASPKVLFITYENPYTRNSGDSIYTCNILDGLKRNRCSVDIIYFDSNQVEPYINSTNSEIFKNKEVVSFKKKKSLQFILSTLPGMVVNRYSKSYLQKLRGLLKKQSYNYIFINHQKMIFTLAEILKENESAKLIYISHNVEYLLSKNLVSNYSGILNKVIYWQDLLKTSYFEKKWVQKFDAVSAISEHDCEYFKKEYNAKNVQILRPVLQQSNSKRNFDDKSINEIIIGGSFEWGPKKENLIQLLNSSNLYLFKKHKINLTIVGKAEERFVNHINKKYGQLGVNMIGPVDSLEPFYNKARIAIIPEKLGGGFKLKIIEAALSKTAIFSIKGAITKCNFVRDRHFVEADNFEELIEKIVSIQNSPTKLEGLIENAYKKARESYNMGEVEKSLLKLMK